MTSVHKVATLSRRLDIFIRKQKTQQGQIGELLPPYYPQPADFDEFDKEFNEHDPEPAPESTIVYENYRAYSSDDKNMQSPRGER